MQVAQYTFQSPSSSQVQIGTLDPNSKDETAAQKSSTESTSSTNQSLENDKALDTTQAQEVNPAIKSAQLLDLYA